MGKPFKMKGHTLPGINQRSEGDTDLPDGRSASAALQYRSPAKVTDTEKAKNLAKVDPKYRDEAYYAKVKEVTGADVVKSGGKTY